MPAEVETMFYYGETPWHGQGTPVDHVLTAQEAIAAAGLDWLVETVPVYTNIDGAYNAIEGKQAIRRNTDGKVLSILGTGYHPVQNQEAFNFFDGVVASKEAHYHTAGSLMGGRWVWLLAKLNGGNSTISIKGDAVDKHLLLINGHDGSLPFKMFFTPIRVVCMNTLMAADAEAKAQARGGKRPEMFYARHSETIHNRMGEARDILGISLKFYGDFAEKAMHLANLQLPAAQMPKLLAAAFGSTGAIRPQDVVNLDDFTKRSQERMVAVTRLFDGEGKGLNEPGIKHTKWAAYNAVVEYIDYGRKYGGADSNDTRLKNTLFSKGAAIKKRAWNYLMA